MRLHAVVQKGFLCSHTSLAMKLLVCGVFSEAVYLKSSNHEMFLIHDIRYGLIPFGIAITDAKYFMERYNIKVGMDLTWKENVLCFPEANIYIAADEQKPSISGDYRLDRDALMRTVICGTEILRKCNKGSVKEILWSKESENIKNIYAKKAYIPLQKLEKGMKNEDVKEIKMALLSLLGLGPGLTPSMDDFLTAVVFTCLFIERSWKTDISGTKILARQIIQLAQERTGEFSAAYLMAAAGGGCFSLLEDLLCAEDANASKCEQLLKVGNSSGADQLSGVIWSLQYILKQLKVIHV